MLRAFSLYLQGNSVTRNTPFFCSDIFIGCTVISCAKVKGIHITQGVISTLKLHIKPRSRSDAHIRSGDSLILCLIMLRTGMAAARNKPFLRHIVMIQPEGKFRFQGIAVLQRQRPHHQRQLLIALANGRRVFITWFPQIAAAQHLAGFAIAGAFCDLVLHIFLGAQPAHAPGFKLGLFRSTRQDEFKVQGTCFIGRIGCIVPHLALEISGIADDVKGTHRIIQVGAIVTGSIILVPWGASGTDR